MSVVIPTRNRASVLEKCLKSLTTQTLSRTDFEVIVVDNGSTDETQSVAAKYAGLLNLDLIFASEPGLHVGRHAGCRHAKSDTLVFADDDIQAEPTWVEAVANAFRDPAVALVGGNNYPLFEAEVPDWLRLWWSRPVYRGRALGYLSVLDFGTGRFPIDPAYVWGCNFSIRRQALEAVGGFHPDSLPADRLQYRGDGETHVSRGIKKRGWAALFDSDASVHHRVSAARLTAGYFQTRAYAQGVSDSYTDVRARGRLMPHIFQRQHVWLRSSLRSLRARRAADGSARGDDQRELLTVQLATIRAWRDGYLFHQESLRKNTDLLSWVLRESYAL